jgi:glycogen(starch) synthase
MDMTIGGLLVGGVLVSGESVYSSGWQPLVHEHLADQPGHVTLTAEGITFFQVAPQDAVEVGVALAQRWRPDVVHLHSAWLWPVARAIREQVGSPFVFTVHSLDRAEYEWGGLSTPWQTQEEVIAAAERVIAISQSERDLLLNYCPSVCDRVSIVGNGIDDTALARKAVRKKHPICADDPPLVMYSGRFVERKGIRELLAAIPKVLATAPQTRFVLVGGYGNGGEIESTWMTDALRPYRHQVHFTGWLPPAEVAHWYSVADLLVVPSWYEPFGMVILEGMLYGLPIAAAAVGGPAEILRDEHTGLLFPPQNSEALAHTTLRLVQSAVLRQQIGSAAATEVRRNWLWPQIVVKMRQVYQTASHSVT